MAETADGALFSPSAFSGHAHSIREPVFYTRYLPLLNMGKQGKSKCAKRGQKLHVAELFHMEMNKKISLGGWEQKR